MTVALILAAIIAAVKDEVISPEIAQKILDGYHGGDLIQYLEWCGQQSICSNYQALHLQCAVKEVGDEKDRCEPQS